MSERIDTMRNGPETLTATDTASLEVTRRSALKLAGVAALATGGGIAAPKVTAQAVPTFDRLDHIYFLLNIHWLQAGLYSRAFWGRGIAPELRGEAPGTAVPTYPVTTFTDSNLRSFVLEALGAEIAQITTLMGQAASLDGPGKIANLRAPEIWFEQAGILNDGYSSYFLLPFSELASQSFNLATQDHFLTAVSFIRDIALKAYQTVVAAVPGDTTFPAFMAVQSQGAAIQRDFLYERSQVRGSALLAINVRINARIEGTAPTSIQPVTTPSGRATNIVVTDDRGRARISSYKAILEQLVGPRDPFGAFGGRSLFFKSDFIGRINAPAVGIF
jgi:hypothetical protein